MVTGGVYWPIIDPFFGLVIGLFIGRGLAGYLDWLLGCLLAYNWLVIGFGYWGVYWPMIGCFFGLVVGVFIGRLLAGYLDWLLRAFIGRLLAAYWGWLLGRLSADRWLVIRVGYWGVYWPIIGWLFGLASGVFVGRLLVWGCLLADYLLFFWVGHWGVYWSIIGWLFGLVIGVFIGRLSVNILDWLLRCLLLAFLLG